MMLRSGICPMKIKINGIYEDVRLDGSFHVVKDSGEIETVRFDEQCKLAYPRQFSIFQEDGKTILEFFDDDSNKCNVVCRSTMSAIGLLIVIARHIIVHRFGNSSLSNVFMEHDRAVQYSRLMKMKNDLQL